MGQKLLRGWNSNCLAGLLPTWSWTCERQVSQNGLAGWVPVSEKRVADEFWRSGSNVRPYLSSKRDGQEAAAVTMLVAYQADRLD